MAAKKTVYKVITALVAVVTLVLAVYIVANHLGLNPDYDFGAGAYYYADIPDFEKIIDTDVYEAKLPYFVYVLLFLAWGALMYFLWKRIDRRK
ncbi:MAG: hypothetical protein J6Y27_00140 [Bacteroidales bacterium]|nr:hypothetical protein [Bacteroidales bacterium]